MECMPRRLRLQYSDAIYHVMARGNGRLQGVRPKQKLSCDPGASMLQWSACHDDYAFSTPTRSIMSWPAVMGVRTSCATTLIAIGFKNSFGKAACSLFLVQLSTLFRDHVQSPARGGSKLRSLTSAVACRSFLSAYANGWSRRHRFSGHKSFRGVAIGGGARGR